MAQPVVAPPPGGPPAPAVAAFVEPQRLANKKHAVAAWRAIIKFGQMKKEYDYEKTFVLDAVIDLLDNTAFNEVRTELNKQEGPNMNNIRSILKDNEKEPGYMESLAGVLSLLSN